MTERAKLDSLRLDADDRAAGRHGRGRWLLPILVFAVVGAIGYHFWRASTLPVVTTAPVETIHSGTDHVDSVLEASGYVVARRAATVSSKVTGKVVEVLVEEGMEVEEGQVLARLDDAIPRRQLALAESELAAADSQREETRVRLAEARRNLERTRNLVGSGVATESDLDADQAEVDSLSARLKAAGDSVEVAREVARLRRQELDDTIIRAPFDGVAISKNAQPGEMISPMSAGGGFTRTGISTIVDMSSLEIEVDVNEAFINRVEPDQRTLAVLDAYPDWEVPSRVITTVPAADRQKATVRVRIGFDELDPRVLPDMGVKVSFLESPEAPDGDRDVAPTVRHRVPRAAIRQDGDQEVVWVVSDGTLERRAVRLGRIDGNGAEVEAGLEGGEQVMIVGPDAPVAGTRVKTE